MELERLYEFSIQQIVAESYLEDFSRITDIDYIKRQLRMGTNRPDYVYGGSTSVGDPDLNQGWPGLTRLTDPQIDEFIDKYEILHQWSDNPSTGDPEGERPAEDEVHTAGLILNGVDMLANTGFAATLIRDRRDGQYTLAIRSTESRPWDKGGDAERDMEATDKWGVAATGFALAQLDALEKYYEWLKVNNFISYGATLNVTGYSLGGHLATVFTEIHKDDPYIASLANTVTFNGAGRGTWNGSAGTEADFLAYYRQVLSDPKSANVDLSVVSSAQQAFVYGWARATGFVERAQQEGSVLTQLNYLQSIKDAAISRTLTGVAFDPTSLYADFRYGWAVISTMLKFGLAPQLPGEEHMVFDGGRITQVYGFETIANHNMTANSQNNGAELAIGIESQPIIDRFAGFSIPLGEREIPLPGDYGFSHSITLITDSLALQRAIFDLGGTLTPRDFMRLLPKVSAMGTQELVGAGYEADALENILDSLRLVILGRDIESTTFKEGPGGYGDWVSRDTFHRNVLELTQSETF
ncbi:MAG: hypothetical protein K0Q68_3147, partial [Moraxellaceae bacterium]|nr:hypothetical protein [Moraxellaceae bacterium]